MRWHAFPPLFWPSSRQDEDGGDHRDQRKDHGFLYDQIHPGTGGNQDRLIGTLGVIGDQTIKTINTTPESYEIQKYLYQMAEEGCQCAVLEASSLGLKWHRTAGFIFDYGVFNFPPTISANMSMPIWEEYLDTKSILFRCRKLIGQL